LAQSLSGGRNRRIVFATHLLEEVSRLLNAYTVAILTPGFLDSHIAQGYQGEALTWRLAI
jgi:hypothetical protein